MDQIFLLLITILPTIALLIFFIFSDKFVEPKKTVFQTFILGMFIIAPLEISHTFIDLVLGDDFVFDPFLKAFFQAAFLEEFFKFCVLFYFCSTFTHFNEPMDGIVYGITASLGFAFYENITYVYFADTFRDSLEIAWARAFTAVPSHAFDGVIMGFFIGRYYFIKKGKNINLSLALVIPILFHGTYDWVLMEESINYKLMYLVIILEIALTVFLYKSLSIQQKTKIKESQIRFR